MSRLKSKDFQRSGNNRRTKGTENVGKYEPSDNNTWHIHVDRAMNWKCTVYTYKMVKEQQI